MYYIKKAEKRPNIDSNQVKESVAEIIQNVKNEGDTAVLRYNQNFDNNHARYFKVTDEMIKEAYSKVPLQLIEHLKVASHNIQTFAEKQRETITDLPNIEIMPGLSLGHRIIPVDACCCYVPGGNYPLFSSALMLIIPAKVAGVKRVVACSPVQKNSNTIAPATLVAMDIAGVDEIYQIGGAHAIAAFSFGTEQIKPVDLIVGPGNQYVTEAKRQCYGQVGIDFVAGPSEVMIIADKYADPNLIAADLLAQSEHDLLAKGILVTTDEALGQRVQSTVIDQLNALSTKEIAERSWSTYGEIIVVDTLLEAIEIANNYAPEHLELNIENPESIQDAFTNYGSLFLGEHSAEVFGDYISGTNHTLPTLRAARYTGGVWVGTFLKTLTHQRLSPKAVVALGPAASSMARAEGLDAHANAVDIRLKKWEN